MGVLRNQPGHRSGRQAIQTKEAAAVGNGDQVAPLATHKQLLAQHQLCRSRLVNFIELIRSLGSAHQLLMASRLKLHLQRVAQRRRQLRIRRMWRLARTWQNDSVRVGLATTGSSSQVVWLGFIIGLGKHFFPLWVPRTARVLLKF